MTTPAAEALYLAQHRYQTEGLRNVIFNPKNKPLEELPYIMGFNNGGSPGWLHAAAIAQDGTVLGGHCCSHEGYMEHDLGIIEGARTDRHERYRAHYPEGYLTRFVPSEQIESDALLQEAFRLNKLQGEKSEAEHE